MSWLALLHKDRPSFVSLDRVFTAGSRRGVDIELSGAPLMFRIQKVEGACHVKNFVNGRDLVVERGSTLRENGVELYFDRFDHVWDRHRETVFKDIKADLNLRKDIEPQNLIERASERFFLSRTIPKSAQEQITSFLKEFHLESPIETLLQDSAVTDILVQSHDDIWIEKDGELQQASFRFTDEAAYKTYLTNLLSSQEKSIDEARPYLDFTLDNGSRAHLVGPPVTQRSYCLSIRRPNSRLLSLDRLAEKQMFTTQAAKQLRTWLRTQRNLLISGATGSGKTTLIRALLHDVSETERLIIVEDNREITLCRKNCVSLLTRPEGLHDYPVVGLEDLVRQSLRMRPDRIIVGEVRGGEALDLLHAMNTGHRGCMGSLHANSARDGLERLVGLVQKGKGSWSENAIRKLIVSNIHGLIHLERDSRGKRLIKEMFSLRGLEGEQFILEPVF